MRALRRVRSTLATVACRHRRPGRFIFGTAVRTRLRSVRWFDYPCRDFVSGLHRSLGCKGDCPFGALKDCMRKMRYSGTKDRNRWTKRLWKARRTRRSRRSRVPGRRISGGGFVGSSFVFSGLRGTIRWDSAIRTCRAHRNRQRGATQSTIGATSRRRDRPGDRSEQVRSVDSGAVPGVHHRTGQRWIRKSRQCGARRREREDPHQHNRSPVGIQGRERPGRHVRSRQLRPLRDDEWRTRKPSLRNRADVPREPSDHAKWLHEQLDEGQLRKKSPSSSSTGLLTRQKLSTAMRRRINRSQPN